MRYYLAFDVGTTAMKCILFDKDFNEAASTSKEYSLIIDSNGMTELDAEKYYSTFCECVVEIISRGYNPKNIKSVTFTTQGETFVCIDEHGKPLARAIVWLDSRAADEAEYIRNGIGDAEFYSKTGLWQPDGALPLAKVMNIKKNQPDVYRRTYKFMLLEDYLIFRLTGRYVTEKSLVSSTGWYDIIGDEYYKAALDLCDISLEKFPDVLSCGAVVGGVSDRKCGLSEDTLVVCGAMDQICSAIGSGNISEGIVTETTGTALVLGATVDKPVFDGENPITIYRHYNDKYIYMPYCNTAGIVLKWFKETIAAEICAKAEQRDISAYQMIDEYAEKAECGSGGVILLPHFGGKSTSEIMSNASGAFMGLTLKTTLNDLTRSVLEGVAYMLCEMLEQLNLNGVYADKILSMGGGANSRIWGEIKASVCGTNIEVNRYGETTALGAAMLGAVACGEYDSVCAAAKIVKDSGEIITPNAEWMNRYEKIYEKYKEIYKLLKPIFK